MYKMAKYVSSNCDFNDSMFRIFFFVGDWDDFLWGLWAVFRNPN